MILLLLFMFIVVLIFYYYFNKGVKTLVCSLFVLYRHLFVLCIRVYLPVNHFTYFMFGSFFHFPYEHCIHFWKQSVRCIVIWTVYSNVWISTVGEQVAGTFPELYRNQQEASIICWTVWDGNPGPSLEIHTFFYVLRVPYRTKREKSF